MDLTTISGTVFDVAGEPKSGVVIFIEKTLKDDVVINQRQTQVAISDEDGEVSFTVPRDSTVYLYGSFFINGNSFLVENTGLAVSIPDSATADLEDLAIAIPDDTIFLDTDNTLAANSDQRVASQKAIKAHVAGVSASLSAHTSNVSNPHGVTKSQVGLGSADNTSDVNKPVSTAQATADSAVASAASADATTKANTAQANAITASLEKWSLNFTDDGDAYIPAIEAMTIGAGVASIGSGSLAYEKSTSGSPSVFSSTSLPATLQTGAWLKVTATGVSGFLALQLRRTA